MSKLFVVKQYETQLIWPPNKLIITKPDAIFGYMVFSRMFKSKF